MFIIFLALSLFQAFSSDSILLCVFESPKYFLCNVCVQRNTPLDVSGEVSATFGHANANYSVFYRSYIRNQIPSVKTRTDITTTVRH